MLDKPAAGTTVVVDADASLTVGGTQEPAALVWLQSIGCISRAENKQWTALLYPHLQSSLGIPGDRIFLRFIDISRDDLAWNGKTFDDILPPE
ncbi:hypothetical protein TYRP_002698 [Tyrophagus putrescentiae]|nr:hypothetical protein TYRP_002698 [Tyrophagus putrescentiae]